VVAREKFTDVAVEIKLARDKDEPVAIEAYDRLPVSRQPKELLRRPPETLFFVDVAEAENDAGLDERLEEQAVVERRRRNHQVFVEPQARVRA
jgi:hypothetical protein